MSMTCKLLFGKHQSAWDAAIHHPFLDACQTGAIKTEQFNTWLVQDYLFVLEFTRMTARLTAQAPAAHLDGILGGLAALRDELNWFRAKAAERWLSLDVGRQPICRSYCEFMSNLAGETYAVQATAFWAIEAVYNRAWQLPEPVAEPYREFAERWGNPKFTAYVELLERQADEALSAARRAERTSAEDAARRVLELEKLFWEMAYEGGGDLWLG